MTLGVLEHYLEGHYVPAPCPTEQAFYALWEEHALHALAPTGAAIAGALLADRLPWVFTAGYQATLRNAFVNLPAGGWAAFAATEDVDDPIAHPGTTLREQASGFVLNGCKSWVAHSKLVDHLIVTVNDPNGDKRRARGVIVARDCAGVTLTHRLSPGFLGALSQGFARFDDTPVERGDILEFEPIRQFGRTEAKFVMLAATAFMLARSDGALQDRLFATAAALMNLIGERETSRQVYARIDRVFQSCVDTFEQQVDTQAIPDYGADGRLFRMYTERVQRRAGYARDEALGADAE